jgi:NTE family protein
MGAKNSFENTLGELDAFEGLPRELLAEIATASTTREFGRDSIVFREGEMVDHFCVVLSGRLTVSHLGRDIAHLERGESFGQLSLMAELPAVTTVRVRHDANILYVPRDLFRRALGTSPDFAARLLKQSAGRLAAISEKGSRPTTIIAVHSAPAGVGKTRFAINLATALVAESLAEAAGNAASGLPGASDPERVLLLDIATEKKRFLDILGFGGSLPLVDLKNIEYQDRDVAEEKGRTHEAGFVFLRVAHRTDRSGDDEGVAPLLSSLSKSFRTIVIDLPPVMDAAIWKFLTHCDLALVLTSGEARHLDQTANLLAKLPGRVKVLVARATDSIREEKESIEERIGRPVDEFLEELGDGDALEFQKRPESRYSRSVRRVARGVLGRLIGLALSSGAARGTSHIGVFRVLEAEGIRPDYIAGTSIGALVGALWALGRSADAIERIARRIRRQDFFHWKDVAIPPSPALMRGTNIEKFIDAVYGASRFRDCVTPMKIVVADIDTAEELVYDSGYIRDAVRASVAIPGILKPVLREGRRIVDGAVINPVPVDVLKRMGIDRIIAVNAIPTAASYEGVNRALLRKRPLERGLIGRLFDLGPESIPNVLDIIVRSHQLMEAQIAEDCCRSAQVIIRPWLPELHWMDFDSSPRFIEAGARAATEALPEIRRLAGR